jgi:hypothetical protein
MTFSRSGSKKLVLFWTKSQLNRLCVKIFNRAEKGFEGIGGWDLA